MSDKLLEGDLLLNIDQVSRLTGVRKSTLRYWEKSFEEFLKPVRTESNRREYRLTDVDMIQTIKRLIEEEHLTNTGVRLKLKQFLAEMKKNNVRRRPQQY
ncbi:MerR family transcriptional regulator [Desulfobacca acetoxidans]|uniref:Regulatory protein MerR n=1 Tax=Desulfobacca acetoxidans (strain ATCC 700848 / DSM 11109 / ASRB2) TaxID=880072 RepID=F2NCP6_DESAR|nr:MerR family transcriptional regulator [Desulfobacca acetoxidans]AEB09327.1 regulatory protein MerR [Desulfobacca acetoxidans DSM 11109]HAY22973.1 MerR family DNA-binding transcriptional regulator [Desulfobacterales bacterium]